MTVSPPVRPRVVGVVHLGPLPGSARGGGARDLPALLDAASREAEAWAAGGADALIVEQFGDAPFRKDAVEPHVVAALTVATLRVREASGLPIGVNVLRNDVLAAASIAAMTGAAFVRANVYVGAALTDQGIIEGRAAEVQDLVKRLGAAIDVWADVDVKHAAAIAPRPLGDLAEDAVERGLAAAVIVTGRATGQPAAIEDIEVVRAAVPSAAVYVGSGATAETIPGLMTVAHGVIVGTAAKKDGVLANPVDVDRVRAIVAAATALPDKR